MEYASTFPLWQIVLRRLKETENLHCACKIKYLLEWTQPFLDHHTLKFHRSYWKISYCDFLLGYEARKSVLTAVHNKILHPVPVLIPTIRFILSLLSSFPQVRLQRIPASHEQIQFHQNKRQQRFRNLHWTRTHWKKKVSSASFYLLKTGPSVLINLGFLFHCFLYRYSRS